VEEKDEKVQRKEDYQSKNMFSVLLSPHLQEVREG